VRKIKENRNNIRELIVYAYPYMLGIPDRKSGIIFQNLNRGNVCNVLSWRINWFGVGPFIGVPERIKEKLNDGRRDALAELLGVVHVFGLDVFY